MATKSVTMTLDRPGGYFKGNTYAVDSRLADMWISSGWAVLPGQTWAQPTALLETRNAGADQRLVNGVLPVSDSDGRLAGLATAGGIPVQARVGLSNYIGPTQLPKWRKASANVRLGVAHARFGFVGDSTFRAAFSNGTVSGLYSGSIAARCAYYLSNLYKIPATNDSFFGDGALGANGGSFATHDPRAGALPAGWSVTTAVYTIGGNAFLCNSGTNPWPFTPTAPFDTYDIIHTTAPGNGTFAADVDGGAATNVNTNATASVTRTTVSAGSLGAHTINIRRVSGAFIIIGIVAYTTGTKTVQVDNLAIFSSKADQWNVSTNPWDPLRAIGTYAAHLWALNLGINDMIFSRPVSSYMSHMQAIITNMKVSGDVILFIPNEIGTGGSQTVTTPEFQLPYRNAIRKLALDNGLPLIDLTTRLGSYDAANTAGFMGDINHPNGVSQDDSGYFLASVASMAAV